MGGGGYAAPIQRYGDLREGRPSQRVGKVEPTYPRGTVATDLGRVLPPFVLDQLRGAMPYFWPADPRFDDGDTLFTGVETRTSSPVRLLRGEDLQATRCKGLIPAGKGPGTQAAS